MIQWIITILIVILALYFAIKWILHYFRKQQKKTDDCAGCSSDCSQCPLHTELEGLAKLKDQRSRKSSSGSSTS
ncbi:MAG: FeoB-associated Cys-rich membrane protein [Bacteroidales bacterium]